MLRSQAEGKTDEKCLEKSGKCDRIIQTAAAVRFYLGAAETMNSYEKVSHTLEPVFDEHSKILILGTFPSVKSREQRFYYGHPQNRFWKVLSALTKERLPETIAECTFQKRF